MDTTRHGLSIGIERVGQDFFIYFESFDAALAWLNS